jgi:hypothetical protein
MQLAIAVAVRVLVVMAIVGLIGYLIDKSQDRRS